MGVLYIQDQLDTAWFTTQRYAFLRTTHRMVLDGPPEGKNGCSVSLLLLDGL